MAAPYPNTLFGCVMTIRCLSTDPAHVTQDALIHLPGDWCDSVPMSVFFCDSEEEIEARQVKRWVEGAVLTDDNSVDHPLRLGLIGSEEDTFALQCPQLKWTAEQRGTVVDELYSHVRMGIVTKRTLERMEDGAEHFAVMTDRYANMVDRMVNYTSLDNRVYKLALSMRRRLADFSLKFERDGSLLQEELESIARWDQQRGSIVRVTNSDEPLSRTLLPNTTGALDRLVEQIRWNRDQAFPLLGASKELVSAMTDSAADQAAASMNVVLYWLGILTFFFGLVTIFDKYLTDLTFGLPSTLGLAISMSLLLAMAFFFVWKMARQGLLGSTTRNITQWMTLALLDLVVFSKLTSALPGIRLIRRRWIGDLWVWWTEWKLTLLVEGDLITLRERDRPTNLADVRDLAIIEKHALELFLTLWEDLELKYWARWKVTAQWTRKLRDQLKRIRYEVLLNLAFDLLLLEVPWPCPSPPIQALFYWKVPVVLPLNIAEKWRPEEAGLIDYFESFSAKHMEGKPTGRALRRRFRKITAELLAKHWPEAPDCDELVWQAFSQEVLTGALPTLRQTISQVPAAEIIAAYSSLSYGALCREALEKD
ncbi:MAG: hypothetical protein HN348_03025 [Proteobacteria bacterium]|jgi:hypothetical protein|nr:hypothetical protein [Pseudomonadota bacterium]